MAYWQFNELQYIFIKTTIILTTVLFKPLVAHTGLFTNVQMKWECAILVLKPELLSIKLPLYKSIQKSF